MRRLPSPYFPAIWLALWVFCAAAGHAFGHGQPPTVLSLVETSPDRFAMRLRAPAPGDSEGPPPLQPRFPAHCRTLPAELDCRGEPGTLHGLRGQVLSLARDGHAEDQAAAELIYVITWLDGQRESGLLRPLPKQDRSQLSATEPAETGGTSTMVVAGRYLRLGVGHILAPLQGADHLLFILGLMLLVADLAALLWCVTAFTLGHSLTLSAAALDLLRLPAPPLEALIALSIVFVARELARSASLDSTPAPGISRPGRKTSAPTLALGFGLLHGLGFASALAEAGLPTAQRALALVSFNAGVEVGQLTWVVLWLPLWRVYRRWAAPPDRQRLRLVPAYVLGSLAAALTLSRLIDVFSPLG